MWHGIKQDLRFGRIHMKSLDVMMASIVTSELKESSFYFQMVLVAQVKPGRCD